MAFSLPAPPEDVSAGDARDERIIHMASSPIRGSEMLKARVGARDIEKMIDAANIEGVSLVDFFPIGIPNPDGGWGVWHAAPGSVTKLIDVLIREQTVPNFRIFPKGIPVPDL